MKICVVGGTGNISENIVNLLSHDEHEVTCYNRGISGSAPKGVRFIQGDRRKREYFEKTMQAERFDAAIDMICYTREDALSSIRAFHHVGHFIHCSSVATYGRNFDWLPTTEDHPLRPENDYGRQKVEADIALLGAFHERSFPVTIVKPAITYGYKFGLLRQIGNDLAWLDRIRKGKPIIVVDDGDAIHQFMHAEDVALAFVNILSKSHCLGQVYNLVQYGFTSWKSYHQTAMEILGRVTEMVSVPESDIRAGCTSGEWQVSDIFSHDSYFSANKFRQDIPDFKPRITLEQGVRKVINTLDAEGRIPDSGDNIFDWEDHLIKRQRSR